MTQSRLRIRPAELKDANEFVERLHRHHKRVIGHRWSICVEDLTGRICGVAIVGRPVARMTDQRRIVEVTRVCTDGTSNACSALYGAVCRQQRAMGYDKAQTFILDTEPGTSLLAAGWVPVAISGGGSWSRDQREREDKAPLNAKIRWECRCTDLPALKEFLNA